MYNIGNYQNGVDVSRLTLGNLLLFSVITPVIDPFGVSDDTYKPTIISISFLIFV